MVIENENNKIFNVQLIGEVCTNIGIENVNNANIIIQKDLQSTKLPPIKGVE